MTSTEDLKQIEEIEFDYFKRIKFILLNNIERLIDGLKSRNQIKDDWFDAFTATSGDVSEADVGTERIFYWLLGSQWQPNSSPIGSDLMFEAYNAFLHIEIKTNVTEDKNGRINGNLGDARGKIQIGQNQTSYSPEETWTGSEYDFEPNLPVKYDYNPEGFNLEELDYPIYTLTYGIECIYDGTTQDPLAIILVCIPNGNLREHYGDDIIVGGKSAKNGSRTDFRYAYYRHSEFELLDNDNAYRAEILYFDGTLEKPSGGKFEVEDILADSSPDLEVHYKKEEEEGDEN